MRTKRLKRSLRRAFAGRKRAEPFRLRKAAFKGRGLSPEAARLGWETLHDLAYEGRGAG